MRALVVYAHPRPGSFNAAVRDVVLEKLREAGAEVRLVDLYRDGFAACLTAGELEAYEDTERNCGPVAAHADALKWCDTLIFVYPTWWYGLPAILKGWLDRVLLPGVAFLMPDDAHPDIRPGLTHVKKLAVFTTCGASWWLTALVGAPGRRTLLRGVRFICAKRCRSYFVAHYLMDSSTDQSRRRHLARVGRTMEKMTGGMARGQEVEA
ncbi:NAD(P)H-dependent oxidoreductase [Algicella marina]|uniref:Flavodoxin family protein n=1 Tax=Algicella marina TaxID=2683284 RepID=A0A6P1STX5_9RHOB|nr:NAD(P)H-dependent oxidoreductase [Algicella marina]QHQ33878.1 flavodoxin family protein [Algicella marina]